MAISELEFNGQVVGYRASFKNNVMFDLGLNSAQEYHIYPKVEGPTIKLKQHDGMLVSEDEVKAGILAEDVSDKREKAKAAFLRRDPDTGWIIKAAMGEPIQDGFVYILDISSEGAFDLAKVKLAGSSIYWTNVDLNNEDLVGEYLSDIRKMTLDCLYTKYLDQMIEHQTIIFDSSEVTGDLTPINICSAFYEVYERWATDSTGESGVRVIEPGSPN